MRAVAVAVARPSAHPSVPQLISVPMHSISAQQDMTGGVHVGGQKTKQGVRAGSFTRCDAMMRARENLGRWRLV